MLGQSLTRPSSDFFSGDRNSEDIEGNQAPSGPHRANMMTIVTAVPWTTNEYEISASFRLRAEAASFRQTDS